MLFDLSFWRIIELDQFSQLEVKKRDCSHCSICCGCALINGLLDAVEALSSGGIVDKSKAIAHMKKVAEFCNVFTTSVPLEVYGYEPCSL